MGYFSIHKAIEIAIGSIKSNNDLSPKTKKETIRILNNIAKRDYFTYWDKGKIIRTLKDYKERTGLTPTVTTLTEVGMPKATTVQSIFHIKASLFLKQLFPEKRKTRHDKMYTNPYGFNTEEAWLKCFKEQFEKCGYPTSKRYNALRDKDTPTWNTIARYLGLSTWSELMSRAEVNYPDKKATAQAVKIQSTVSPTMRKLEQINSEKRKLNDELLDLLKL